MRKNKGKMLLIASVILSVFLIGANTYAHPGRTDSRGGHKDNKNKSGLGSYHYHCGGNPPHLHTNGVCPYSSSSSTGSSRTSNASSSGMTSNSKTTSNSTPTPSKAPTQTPKPTSTPTPTPTEKPIISVTEIQINEKINNLDIGESKNLSVSISPYDANDKNVTWKSSDENIATVSSKGEVIAKKSGIVNITATSSNGKTNNNFTNNNNTVINKEKESSASGLGGAIALGALGGGGYYLFKKKK